MKASAPVWIALCLLTLPAKVLAGPWTKGPGDYYAKLSVGGYFADGFRDASGSFQKGVKYRSVSPALYAEAGIWTRLQLSLYVPYLDARNVYDDVPTDRSVSADERLREGNEYIRSSFGDTIIGTQWSSPWLTLPHALRLEAKLPLYDVNGPRGPEQGFFPAPGDGQLDLTLWASVGKSFDALPIYVFGELGHMHRTEKFLFGRPEVVDPLRGPQTYAETLRWFGQSGLRFADNKYLMLNFVGAWPYEKDAFTKGWVSAGLALFLPVGDRGLALEATFDQAMYVTNSARGTSVGVGISLSR